MAVRKWKHKPTAKPSSADSDSELRDMLDQAISPVVRKLKRKCKPFRAELRFNQPIDVFARWYRGSLYIVKVMQSPYERTLPFESHIAKIQPAGKSGFQFYVPMRRGWITADMNLTADECAEKLSRTPVD